MRRPIVAGIVVVVALIIGATFYFVGRNAIRRAFTDRRPPVAEYAPQTAPEGAVFTPAPTDWPAFRGLGGTGISTAGKPPTEWAADKNLAWRVELPGSGASSPIVVGNLVIVLAYSGGTGKEPLARTIVAYNSDSGKQEWEYRPETTHTEDGYNGFLTEHGYASSTPASDGKHIVAMLGKSGVVCLSMTGKELWRAATGTMSANRRWGSAASPIIVGDLVVVNAAEEARALMAFDLATGQQVWKAEGAALELSYGTPVLARNSKGEDELLLGVPDEIWSIHPRTGKLRWHINAPLPGNVSPSPAVANDLVLIQGGYPSTTLVAAPLGGNGKLPADAIRWQTGVASYVPSGLVHDGYFYCVTDKGLAVCLEAATGAVKYQERLDIKGAESRSKPVYASLVLADGHLYAVTRNAGVFVYAVGTSFSKPSVMKLGEGEDFSATPAISGNSMFLRSDTALYCVRH